VRIRPARADEVAAVRAVWAAAESPATVTDDDVSVELLLAHDPEALLVAEDSGRLIGTLVAAFDGWRGNLYRAAVIPSHRRQGIALALVAEAERRLAARGARRIAAIVLDHEVHATSFWAAAGYHRDDRVRRFVKNL
jgi:ribosomal protein S18 acetylase RimI-like enzyme